MRDRQYVLSLLMFAVVVALAIAGMVCLAFWLGWVVAAVLVAMALGFLAWFYLGPRPDLKNGTGVTGPTGP